MGGIASIFGGGKKSSSGASDALASQNAADAERNRQERAELDAQTRARRRQREVRGSRSLLQFGSSTGVGDKANTLGGGGRV